MFVSIPTSAAIGPPRFATMSTVVSMSPTFNKLFRVAGSRAPKSCVLSKTSSPPVIAPESVPAFIEASIESLYSANVGSSLYLTSAAFFTPDIIASAPATLSAATIAS